MGTEHVRRVVGVTLGALFEGLRAMDRSFATGGLDNARDAATATSRLVRAHQAVRLSDRGFEGAVDSSPRAS